MKYLSMDKISDPFIRQLEKEMGVTGFTFRKDGELTIVGQPTREIKESKRDYRIRWKRFYKKGVGKQ